MWKIDTNRNIRIIIYAYIEREHVFKSGTVRRDQGRNNRRK
jgi:hypothetical protein